MTNRIVLQPGFVLHARPYRDTSSLLELLTMRYGRVAAVARGVRRQRSASRGLLRPFVPLVLSWSGKGELVTLTQVEAAGALHEPMGKALLSGLYLNELLVRVLHRHDPHPEIFKAYQQALNQMQTETSIEPALRYFELVLLRELGYGFDLDKEALLGKPVLPDAYYTYISEKGLLLYKGNTSARDFELFKGEDLLAFHRYQLAAPSELQTAKRLMRSALAPLLGSHALKSRDLFR